MDVIELYVFIEFDPLYSLWSLLLMLNEELLNFYVWWPIAFFEYKHQSDNIDKLIAVQLLQLYETLL